MFKNLFEKVMAKINPAYADTLKFEETFHATVEELTEAMKTYKSSESMVEDLTLQAKAIEEKLPNLPSEKHKKIHFEQFYSHVLLMKSCVEEEGVKLKSNIEKINTLTNSPIVQKVKLRGNATKAFEDLKTYVDIVEEHIKTSKESLKKIIEIEKEFSKLKPV